MLTPLHIEKFAQSLFANNCVCVCVFEFFANKFIDVVAFMQWARKFISLND